MSSIGSAVTHSLSVSAVQDTALAVLQAVIDDSTPGSAKWAWMRRGLYHLKVGQQPQAIAEYVIHPHLLFPVTFLARDPVLFIFQFFNFFFSSAFSRL